MNSSRPSPFQFHPQLNGKRPFCELATFNIAYFDAITRGAETAVKDFEQIFDVSDYYAFPKVQIIHASEHTRKDRRP